MKEKKSFEFKFKASDDISNEDLNDKYGDKGKTFSTIRQAKHYQKELKKIHKDSYITSLYHYQPKDIEVYWDGRIAKGNPKKKKYSGFLVTVIGNEILTY